MSKGQRHIYFTSGPVESAGRSSSSLSAFAAVDLPNTARTRAPSAPGLPAPANAWGNFRPPIPILVAGRLEDLAWLAWEEDGILVKPVTKPRQTALHASAAAANRSAHRFDVLMM